MIAFKFTFVILCALACLYSAGAKVVLLEIDSHVAPVTVKINLLGYPGLVDRKFEMTGMFKETIVASSPMDLGSETAHGFRVQLIQQNTVSKWLNQELNLTAHSYNDFVVLPHSSYTQEIIYHPNVEEFWFGMAKESRIWQEFPDGATFCRYAQSLFFYPKPKRESCLETHLINVKCNHKGALYCEVEDPSKLYINDVATNKLDHVFLAPFDYTIDFSENLNDDCNRLKRRFYNTSSPSSLELKLASGNIKRTEEDLVMPDKLYGASFVDKSIKCNRPIEYLPNNSVMIGLMGTGTSFVYKPMSNRLEVYTSRKNSMRNTWPDVIVINLCLLAFAHWLADRDKDFKSNWTIWPELIGSAALLAGLYFQHSSTGAYFRVADFDQGSKAVVGLCWCILANLTAHLASLIVLFETRDTTLRKKALTLRTASYEFSILGSVFIQVISGSLTMFDSYMGFLAGVTLVFNATYRCLELYYNNSTLIVIISFATLVVSSYAFYTMAAAPAVDPLAGMAEHIHEASLLCLISAITLGIMNATEARVKMH